MSGRCCIKYRWATNFKFENLNLNFKLKFKLSPASVTFLNVSHKKVSLPLLDSLDHNRIITGPAFFSDSDESGPHLLLSPLAVSRSPRRTRCAAQTCGHVSCLSLIHWQTIYYCKQHSTCLTGSNPLYSTSFTPC
jgi:hypothetical protein